MVLNDLQDQQVQNDVFDPSLLGNKQHQLFYLKKVKLWFYKLAAAGLTIQKSNSQKNQN